jgi:apolipoprotein D and lipocalin family protein
MNLKQAVLSIGTAFLVGCSSMKYTKTVEYVDMKKFMGEWYVWAGRTTFLEKGAHNAIEIYTWNESEKRIDIAFDFKKDAFDGKPKSIPQKGWIHNDKTNAHWKVRPFWPLSFDYLIIALDPNYKWTAVGVPNGKYLWIMGREPVVSDVKLDEITSLLREEGYPVQDIQRIPQKWD